MSPLLSSRSIVSSPWIYFAATFAWTWGFCALLIFGDLGAREGAASAILLLAMIGPGVTGILFNRLANDPQQRRDFWRRVVDPRRARAPWLLATLAIPFVLQLSAGLFDGLFGGAGPCWGDAAPAFLAEPMTQLLSLWIITLVPFFEELGWRGYAQDRLMRRHSGLGASVILGVVWSLWHLPAFFVPGTYHADLGFFSIDALLFFVGVVALSVVVSWIYLNTGRSILVMALLHATVNLSGELIALTPRGEIFFTLAWIALAVAVALVCGRSLRFERRRPILAPASVATLLVLGIVIAGPAGSARAERNAPADELAAELTAVLDSLRVAHDLPGLTAAYALPGGEVVTAAAGAADRERGIPMRTDTPMLAASIGKTFVAATAAALHDEGVIDLDAPVARWLGERSWWTRLPNHEVVTLRHLLDHTSGLADHVHEDAFREAFARAWRDGAPTPDAETCIGLVLDRQPAFAPGEGFAYSDTGYRIAALALEEATGRPLTVMISERWLRPLGLDGTFPSDRPDLPGLACGYVGDDDPFGLPRRTIDENGVMVFDPAIEGAGGGFASTSRDLAVWARWAFTEGPTRPERVPFARIDEDRGYGLGVASRRGDTLGPVYGHAGWIPGTVSSLRYYPDHGVAVAFQVNTDAKADVFVSALEAELARRAVRVATAGNLVGTRQR